MAMPRCVAGIEWEGSSRRLPQVVLKLTRDECWALSTAGRLERLKEFAGPGAHVQLVERANKSDGQPYLIITGTKDDAIQAAMGHALRMLTKDEAVTVTLHPHDVQQLRNQHCLLLEQLERESGCRVVMSDCTKQSLDDLHRNNHHQDIFLLGDQRAQARAVDLLARHCTHAVRPAEEPRINLSNSMRDRPASAFDPVRRGENVHLDAEGVRACRSEACDGYAVAGHCVVALNGAVPETPVGAFFCLRVRRLHLDRGHRSGMRVALSRLPVEAPVPDSLVLAPERAWVLGRGAVRGPDGLTHPLPCAAYDGLLREGDDLGVLVTRSRGGIAVFHRQGDEGSKRSVDGWSCVTHWAAELDAAAPLYALIELAGRPAEVELLQGERPPQGVSREADWPPRQLQAKQPEPPAAAEGAGAAGAADAAAEGGGGAEATEN